MTTRLKLRRGTTAEHSTFVGGLAEATVDTTKDTIVVHDGVTPGGFPLAKEATVTALEASLGSSISGKLNTNNPVYTGTLTGGTGVVNLGSGQVYKAADGKVGLGTDTPAARLDVSGNQATNIVAVPALDIDCSAGNYFTKTIAANSTFTVSNVPSGRAYSFTLEVTHTSGTITWFSGVQWPNGTAPTLTTGKAHLFVFVTDDGGTRWRGAALTDFTI